MFCPRCGFESTQKTNFCKRCGANIIPAANSVEINMPKPRATGMAITIAAFSLIGLLVSNFVVDNLSHRFPPDLLFFTFIACLFFVFTIAGSLVWQLSRLISTYKDAIRQTINKAQFEPAVPPQSVFPQALPAYMPAPKEPVQSSVTEHTTRQMAAGYRDPRMSE